MRFMSAVVLIAFAYPQLARADLILDQVYEGPATATLTMDVPSGVLLAQTFTPGSTGTMGGFDFRITNGGTLGTILWDIRAAAGSPQVADTPVLASGSIDGNSIPTGTSWVEVRGFSVPMASGDDLAIVLRGGAGGGWHIRKPGSFAGGEAWARSESGTQWFDQFGDFLFRTYAVTSAVPEPSSCTLVGMVAVIFGAYYHGRRRIKQAVTT